MEDIATEIGQMSLSKGDCLLLPIYLDLLSKSIFMATDENGFIRDLPRDGTIRWHIGGSLVLSPNPLLKKILVSLTCLAEAAGGAQIVCVLPLPRYVGDRCCVDTTHIDNLEDSDYADIVQQALVISRSVLETVFPGALIYDPLTAFGGPMDMENRGKIVSSSGLAILSWEDLVYLSESAYSDVGGGLIGLLRRTTDQGTTRLRLESVVTRPRGPPSEATGTRLDHW